MTNYSFSYSPSYATNATPPAAPLWSFNSAEVFPGPSGMSVIYCRRNGMRAIVQDAVVHALHLCNKFQTLEQHAQLIAARIPEMQGQEADALNTLQQLSQMGLLESAEDAWARISADKLEKNEATDVKHGPVTVFIITCDRPEALKRLLASMGERPLPGQIDEIVVVDDSRNEQNIASNGVICSEASASLGRKVRHFDMAAREQFIAALQEAQPAAKDAIDFFLERSYWGEAPTHGLARNLAQLLGAGKRNIVLDDDVLCHAIAPPVASRHLKLGSIGDREAVLYPSRESMGQHELKLDQSPFELVIPTLGARLSEAVRGHSGLSGPASLSGWDGNELARFTCNSKTTLTQTGYWGDVGSSRASWLFFLPKSSLEKVLQSGSTLSELLEANSAWLGFRGPTLTPYGAMSACTGIDNRELLPPYFPAYRGEDLLFALMLQRIHPNGMVHNSGWAIPHLPVEDRLKRAKLDPVAAALGMNTLAEWIGREPDDQWGQTPELRLQRLSEEIRNLALMEATAAEDLLKKQMVSRNTSLLTHCMGHLEEVQHMTPSPGVTDWAQYLNATRDGLVKELQGSDRSMNADDGEELNQTRLAELGKAFSAALGHWATLRAAAVAINKPA